MKGFRFYAEMPKSRKSKSASKANPFFPWTVAALRRKAEDGSFRYGEARPCVVAVDLQDNGRLSYNLDGSYYTMIAPVLDGNHSSYGYTSGGAKYLAKRCTRIPEDLARILSPELFRYLES